MNTTLIGRSRRHPPAATGAAAARPRDRPGRSGLLGWVYALPTAIFVALLFLIPLGLVLLMSVSRWPLLTGFRGFNPPANFTKALGNRFFLDSLLFTVKYTVLATVLLIGLGLGLALLVQESSRWNGVLRTAFLVPSALGLASASLLFYVLYSPIAGPFAPAMNALGLSFLGTPNSALVSTLFLIVWRYAGFYMLLMLVGLQGIPAEVYEAARIDGGVTAAALPPHHAAAAAPDAGTDHDPLRHRLAAGVRAVLHPDQGRPGQQHDLRRPARLHRRVPGAERPRGRSSPVRAGPRRARPDQRGAAARLPPGREVIRR